MTINIKNIFSCSILICISFSLINTKFFEPTVFTAYFTFTILSLILASLACFLRLFEKLPYRLKNHECLFLLITACFFIQGKYENRISIAHNYWICLALWIFSLNTFHTYLDKKTSNGPNDLKYNFLQKGIVIIAIMESMLVMLQFAKLMPSNSSYFQCTGSLSNPNITASFLAFSLFTIQNTSRKFKVKYVPWVLIIIVLVAILLLQSRTALIIALVFVVGHNYNSMKNRLYKNFKKQIFLNLLLFLSLGGLALLMTFTFKNGSTSGRFVVIQNAFQLILDKPVFGHGSGTFEKNYNLFVAERSLKSLGHVNMAYNDFIELTVEGGIIGLALWIGYLLSSVYYNQKNKCSQLPVICIIIMQVTNFGFQATPAFLLFLIYQGTNNYSFVKEKQVNQIPTQFLKYFANYGRLILSIFLLYISLFFLKTQYQLAKSYHQLTSYSKQYTGYPLLLAYNSLSPALQGFAIFHIKKGDAYLGLSDYKKALEQYHFATKRSSSPDLFNKCGFCLQQMEKYDSSEYFFNLSAGIEPHKFTHQLALLNLYCKKNDKERIIKTADKIIAMPIKISSKKIDSIKTYANYVLSQQRLFKTNYKQN